MSVRGALRFRPGDRRILLALVAVGMAAAGALFMGGQGQGRTPHIAVAADTLPHPARQVRSSAPASTPQYFSQAQQQAERFNFDPNTADSTQLLRLGLPAWLVRNIYRYREAGGVFRKREDFARLHGLTAKDYRELAPFITISADYLPAATLIDESQESAAHKDTLRYPVKIAQGEYVDLQTADTAALQTVPGIGGYYARQVVSYRERLGGFVSLDQLDEIEGFPQKAKEFLMLGPAPTATLNVNTLSLQQLKQHPYINFYQARAIVEHRRQHGPLADLSELRLLPEFSPEAIERLAPYVSF